MSARVRRVNAPLLGLTCWKLMPFYFSNKHARRAFDKQHGRDRAPRAFGRLAPISSDYRMRPLSGVKRTRRFALHMSASDPKRT